MSGRRLGFGGLAERYQRGAHVQARDHQRKKIGWLPTNDTTAAPRPTPRLVNACSIAVRPPARSRRLPLCGSVGAAPRRCRAVATDLLKLIADGADWHGCRMAETADDCRAFGVDMLPHRPPMRLVEEIADLVAGRSARGLVSRVPRTGTFKGNFPDDPVVPAIVLIELLAQTGGVAQPMAVTVRFPRQRCCAWPRLGRSSSRRRAAVSTARRARADRRTDRRPDQNRRRSAGGRRSRGGRQRHARRIHGRPAGNARGRLNPPIRIN